MKLVIKHYGKKLIGGECWMQRQCFEVERTDLKDMWTSFGLGDMDAFSDDEVQIQIQEKIDEDINRWERNQFSKAERGIDHFYSLNSIADECSDFFVDTQSEISRQQEAEFEAAHKLIRSLLSNKPDWAEIVISKALYDESFVSIAKRMGQSEDSVRKKYNRAIEKLQKVFPKRPD